MYKVLLVDDEPWVLESLKGKISWSQNGFEIIGEALNGFEALEFIKRESPDLVFTDIRMPGINGLELILQAKEIMPEVQFIVVSGYAEFAYAQKAINSGALGYCLKPFDDNEICNLLRKVKDVLNTSRKKIFDLFDLLDIKDIKFPADWENAQCFVMISIGCRELELKDLTYNFRTRLGINKMAYLISEEQKRKMERCFISSITAEIKGIGFSSVIRHTDELEKAMDEAETAAYQFFISENCKVNEYRNQDHSYFSKLVKEINLTLLSKDIKKARLLLTSIKNAFGEGLGDIRDALHLYNTLVTIIYRLVPEHLEYFADDKGQLVSKFKNIGDMIAYLNSIIDKQSDDQTNINNLDIKSDFFKSVLNYVNKNYYNDISLQSVSKQFGINLSYMSQVFKKETGTTFTEYIMRRRISFSCDLLKNSNLSVNEISEKVGYCDYFYFCKVFRKLQDMTPTVYREKSRMYPENA